MESRENDAGNVREDAYNALSSHAIEIRANDLEDIEELEASA